MEKTVKNGIILGIIVLLIGLGSTIFGISEMNKYKENKASYVEVKAKVAGYDYTGTTDDQAYIVYEYSVNGVSYKATSSMQTDNLPEIGKEVTIMYNPSNHREIITSDDSSSIILIVGVVFILVSIFAIFKSISLKKSSTNITYNNTNINDVVGPNNN